MTEIESSFSRSRVAFKVVAVLLLLSFDMTLMLMCLSMLLSVSVLFSGLFFALPAL